MGDSNSDPLIFYHEQKVQVTGVHLLTFLRERYGEHILSDISFVKIDTEGYDRFVLRSIKPLLSLCSPIVQVEWFAKFISKEEEDLFHAIDEVGYLPYDKNGIRPVSVRDLRVSDLILRPKPKSE